MNASLIAVGTGHADVIQLIADFVGTLTKLGDCILLTDLLAFYGHIRY